MNPFWLCVGIAAQVAFAWFLLSLLAEAGIL